MRCNYCKQDGHSLYKKCYYSGKVNIACPKSDHCGRDFNSMEHFQDFLDKRSRVERVCEELWDLDDRLQPNVDYTIRPNDGKLFKFVRQSALNKRIILVTFCDLLKFYHAPEGMKEHYDRKKANELYYFIDLVMKTPVMQRVYKELFDLEIVQNGRMFRKQLWDLWFKFYGDYRCAFKHIFCGEIEFDAHGGHTVGLHNWIRYYEQQTNGNIEYLEWAGNEVPGETANMVTIRFKWMGFLKRTRSSMFIGTSPEFEMALYTLLYFIGDEEAPNNAMFGDHEVNIRFKRGIEGEEPGLLTVYPKEVLKNL